MKKLIVALIAGALTVSAFAQPSTVQEQKQEQKQEEKKKKTRKKTEEKKEETPKS